ncbi:tyrosinase precursor [Diplocarpon rosae]|nr:tyrosinase precursor [Diplocarpon rosae]
MAAVNFPVVGPPKPSPVPADGSLPSRLEIRQLQKNDKQWGLYLLGLDAFKNLNETSDLSYYGISGIHGRPYRPWGGVKGSNVGGWQGYCTHTSILFGPWHRPYLALFEQVLYGIIQDLAAKFPVNTRAQYQEAAASFRIPYWDWAATPEDGDFFPNSVGGSTTVSVITPTSNGQAVSISNPLYSYNFHPLNPVAGDFVSLQGTPYNRWQSTLRYPTSTTSVSAKSDEQEVFQAMASQFAGLQQNVNLILSDPNYTALDAFSNHELRDDGLNTSASLEDVHNSVHVAVGEDMGHMSEANSIETDTTPLAPFADASGTKYWNSLGVRSTQTFNYVYPETQRWKFGSDVEYRNSVLDSVQQLYGDLSSQFVEATRARSDDKSDSTAVNVTATSVTSPKTTATEGTIEDNSAGTQKPAIKTTPASGAESSAGLHPLSKITATVNKLKQELSSDSMPKISPTRGLDLGSEIDKANPTPAVPQKLSYTQYIVNIKTPKHILSRSYRIHVFLGEFLPETRTWNTQDALVGTVVVFGKNIEAANENETGCGKCKTDAERQCVVTGTVPLTSQIVSEVKRGNCPSMDKADVIQYLKEALHWRVCLADGTEKPREDVPGLTVSVVSTEVTIPAGGRRPVYSGVYELHPEVTAGRPAGYGEAPTGSTA